MFERGRAGPVWQGHADRVSRQRRGTDILLRGDEAGLGTPEEDATSLVAVAGLDAVTHAQTTTWRHPSIVNGEIAGRWTEICAYGTAVWVAPVTDQAKAQYEAIRVHPLTSADVDRSSRGRRGRERLSMVRGEPD